MGIALRSRPAPLRAVTGPSTRTAEQPLGGAVEIWAKREDCNSGLAFGVQSGAQARVPRRGRPSRRVRHARLDSVACSRTTPVRSQPSQRDSALVASSCRSAGWSGRTSSTTRSATSSSRGSWVRTCGSTRPASTSGSGGAGRTHSRRSRRAAVSRMRSQPAPRPPAGRAQVRALGRRGGRAGARARRLLRHRRRLLRDRIDPGGDGCRFAAQETDRAVLGIDASATVRQTWAQVARIARATAEAIELGRELDDSRSSSSTSGTRARTASRTRRRSTPFACAPAWKGCSPIPSTRASRWLR